MSLIYRGTSSDDVHFNVTERRVYNAPAFDVTGIEVPGRSGDILNSQERFKNKSIVYTGFIRSSDFPGDTTWERLSRGLRTIKAWVCGDAGKYHDLTDDYDPGFVRRAFVSGETAISEVLDRPDGATITITFMAEPFMYEESDPIELPETGTASGAIASFEGVVAPLQSLKFSISPQQDLHGYSYPWPGGGGKNMLDADGYTLSAPAGVNQILVVDHPVYLEAGVAYTFSCRQSASAGSATRNMICVLPENTTTPLAYETANQATAHTHYVTYTPSTSGNYRPGYWAHTLGNAITLDQWQVEKGSTATAYAPYSNISPISGWSQVDGVAAGKNLAVLEAIGAINLNTGELQTASSSTYARTGKVKCLPNTAYTVSGGWPITQFIIGYYDANDNYLGYAIPSTPASGVSNTSFTTHASAGYMVIIVRRSANTSSLSDFPQFQLEEGSTASPYAAPTLTPITIQFGQTVYGATEEALSGKMTITDVAVDMGDLMWSYITSGTKPYFRTTQRIADILPSTGNDIIQPILCSRYKPETWTHVLDTAGYDFCICVGWANEKFVAITDSTYTNANDFKTAMAGQTLVYRLATPIEIDLTPVSVSSLLGLNNIWASCGDTEVEYVEPTENPTEWPSKPRLEITMAGAGTLTVNGKTWSIGAYTGTLICDSEIMDWYDASNLKNSLVSGDGFPELQPGENVITYTGGITKVVAKPRWRTL